MHMAGFRGNVDYAANAQQMHLAGAADPANKNIGAVAAAAARAAYDQRSVLRPGHFQVFLLNHAGLLSTVGVPWVVQFFKKFKDANFGADDDVHDLVQLTTREAQIDHSIN